VRLVLEEFDLKYGGKVRTISEIPMASGLKSSSAAANATVLATLSAIGESLEPLEAVRLGVRAALGAGVTVTGAFDDACASYLGGIVITDNKEMKLIKREERESGVVILAPEEKVFSANTNVKRSRLLAPWIDLAYDLALKGEYEKAMTLNGFLYCNALGFSTEPMMWALEVGTFGVSLSGTGPAYVALLNGEKADELARVWGNLGGRVIRTKVNNRGATIERCP
jgi:shikimate kinase